MAMREFDLNIERVLENWTVAHALREVIANAPDEQAQCHRGSLLACLLSIRCRMDRAPASGNPHRGDRP
jgi:hypothetical protein